MGMFTRAALVAAALGVAGTASAGYPSKSTVARDVKKSDAKAFARATVVGTEWTEDRHKSHAPFPPDECKIRVEVEGPKKADGTWYFYRGLAIYRRGSNGQGPWRFNRFFIYEDDTTLKGFDPPSREELQKHAIDGIRKFPRIPELNSALTTHVYAIEVPEDMRFQAQSPTDYKYDVAVVAETIVRNTEVEKRRIAFRAALRKVDGEWRFIVQGGGKVETLSKRSLPKSVLDGLPRLSRAGLDAMFGEERTDIGVPTEEELDHALGTVKPVILRSKQWFNRILGKDAHKYVTSLGEPAFDLGRDFSATENGFEAVVVFPLELKYEDQRTIGGPWMRVTYPQKVKLVFSKGEGGYSLTNLTIPNPVVPQNSVADHRTRRGVDKAEWDQLSLLADPLPVTDG